MGSDQVTVRLQVGRPDVPIATPEVATKPEALDPNQLLLIYEDGRKRFGPAFNEAIIRDLQRLDYQVSEVGLEYLDRADLEGISIPPQVIFVQESDLSCRTRQIEMSSGMFRALNLAIQLNYWAETNTQVCMLVDDIGEGLDFERATKLIALLIDKAKKHRFQIIMTTNDRFVMNNVPARILEYFIQT